MSWCRVCHEHDCGIDHGDSRVQSKRKKSPPRKPPLPIGVGRMKKPKPKPKVKASYTQLNLF